MWRRIEEDRGRALARRTNYQGWVIVRRAEDVEGLWTAHCFELDVVTQGRSVGHALEMAAEACTMIVEDDLERGRDSLERRAPLEFWGDLREILRDAEFVGDATALVAGEMTISDVEVFACQMFVTFAAETHHCSVPLAWRRIEEVPKLTIDDLAEVERRRGQPASPRSTRSRVTRWRLTRRRYPHRGADD